MLKILSYVLAFYIGRLSYMVWKNAFLESKRKHLEDVAESILAYGELLKNKEEHVKGQYKELLNLAGEYNSEVSGSHSNWEEWDDILLQHWVDVEK